MKLEDFVNTKPEPKKEEVPVQPAEQTANAVEAEATNTPKPRKKKKKSFFQRFDFSSWISYETVMNNMGFIFFIALIALVYIWNNHYALKSINAINLNEKKLKQLKWEYIYSKSDLEYKSKQSELSKILKTTGITELKNPPTKIYLTNNGGK